MASMRRLIAVALVVAGVALPGCAQRGGGSRGGSMGHSSMGHSSMGHGGGFASRGAPAFRGSSTAMAGPSLMSVPRPTSARPGGINSNLRIVARGAGPNYYYRRPVNAGENRYRAPYRPVYGVGVPYGVAGFIGNDCLDYSDCGYYGDSGYAAQPAPDPAGGYDTQPVEQAEAAPGGDFRPAYQRPQLLPVENEAVTLVFEDGRPSQQIHNYMLTRTTLYVQDSHRQEIPVDELDLAATEKANKDSGVAFQLPGARH